MKQKDKKVFVVTYRDNKNVKHIAFVNGFNSITALKNQYGKFSIQVSK